MLTYLIQDEAFILKGRKLSSAGDALLLQLLTGFLPGVVVRVTFLFESDACIFKKQPNIWVSLTSSLTLPLIRSFPTGGIAYLTTSPRPSLPMAR
jgi:ABC-type phosphate/phosphonate transport system permease subunit